MSPPRTEHGPCVLVLSADVGEGHVAAARALAGGLRAVGARAVVERDGLVAFGAVTRHLIRDGYRWQLRWAPWTYDALYWLATHVRPVRALGAVALSIAGARRLRRIVRRERPDVVVSTHPALTCVLGRMRVRRRLGVPVCAVITDLADFSFWSHRGADLHLVMHEHAIARVERVAGAGSATLVRPLVAPGFLARGDRRSARAALGLPDEGRVVVVSGGGWGVGDLAGAIDIALADGDATVVALAARNDELRAALDRRFAGIDRVRVWGFTDRMDALLRAADVAIHSTGGVTSLEAWTCGCPLIAYGSSIGHIRTHNRTMAELGLLTVAETRAELAAALRTPASSAPPRASADPASAVVDMRVRVRPLPRWRIAAGHALVPMVCAIAVLAGLSTDDAYSLASRPLELRPTTHVATTSPVVGLVVRAPQAAIAGIAGTLAARGVHATFAMAAPPSPALQQALAAVGDDTLPALDSGHRVHWLSTREQLHGSARLGADRRYLAPASGLELGQYLLGRSVDASPVAGALSVDAAHPLPAAPSRGDIVVVTAGGATGPALPAVASLGADGLRAVSLSTLLASTSTSDRTAGAAVRATAPPMTTARPMRIPAGPRGA